MDLELEYADAALQEAVQREHERDLKEAELHRREMSELAAQHQHHMTEYEKEVQVRQLEQSERTERMAHEQGEFQLRMSLNREMVERSCQLLYHQERRRAAVLEERFTEACEKAKLTQELDKQKMEQLQLEARVRRAAHALALAQQQLMYEERTTRMELETEQFDSKMATNVEWHRLKEKIRRQQMELEVQLEEQRFHELMQLQELELHKTHEFEERLEQLAREAREANERRWRRVEHHEERATLEADVELAVRGAKMDREQQLLEEQIFRTKHNRLKMQKRRHAAALVLQRAFRVYVCVQEARRRRHKRFIGLLQRMDRERNNRFKSDPDYAAYTLQHCWRRHRHDKATWHQVRAAKEELLQRQAKAVFERLDTQTRALATGLQPKPGTPRVIQVPHPPPSTNLRTPASTRTLLDI
mmetsp:Transcript_93018/g.161224  ORF Transcript_93018/g.161224 Transcript_93018/m.161224 type:complete len:417 (-) Transcript_93018:185-1435(-)